MQLKTIPEVCNQGSEEVVQKLRALVFLSMGKAGCLEEAESELGFLGRGVCVCVSLMVKAVHGAAWQG